METQMGITGWLVLIVVAAVAGFVAQVAATWMQHGKWLGLAHLLLQRDKLLSSLVVGLMGASIAYWADRALALPNLGTLTVEGQRFPLGWIFVGALLTALTVATVRHR